MIDLHCHIIPGIDDGAKDMETALEMCRMAEKDGIEHIIATPHYIPGDLHNEKHIIQEKVDHLQQILTEQGIQLSIYSGCEAFICPELFELVKQGSVCTLNHSQYLLIELPMMSIPEYTSEAIYQLKLGGYTPIIAHPERNRVIAEDPNTLYELIGRGAVTQVNATSLNGVFGRKVKETALILLKHDMVHTVSSDAHTMRGRSPRLSKALKTIRAQLGQQAVQTLIDNSRAVLHNQMIHIPEPQRVKPSARFMLKVNEFRQRVSGILG